MGNGDVLNGQIIGIGTFDARSALVNDFNIPNDHIGEVTDLYAGFINRLNTDIFNDLTIVHGGDGGGIRKRECEYRRNRK